MGQQNIDLNSEVVLDEVITPLNHSPLANNDALLLTDVTGYLGALLLRELLNSTKNIVYGLVNASDLASGFEQLQTSLAHYNLLDEINFDRVILLLGDLSRPRLALTERAFQLLANNIDAIIHNGMHHNLKGDYQSLKMINVDGTKEILRLACTGTVKPCHYLSTISLSKSIIFHNQNISLADDKIVDSQTATNGYLQTRWVAEQIVRLAMQRGLPATIYRIGSRIDQQMEKMAQKTSLKDVMDDDLDMDSATYISQAIVAMTQQASVWGRTFQIVG